jgi:hypothetical protein
MTEDPDDSGFSTPPPELTISEVAATAPNQLEKDQAGAVVELLKIHRIVTIGRAVAGALAYAIGILIVISIVCIGAHAARDAWRERTVFGAGGQGERLKYLIAFFTFRAAALGGGLTAGLLLVRAGNRLSAGSDTHGADDDDSES